VPVVTAHFNVAALFASAVVMVCAFIDAFMRFTAGVEGFNPGHARLDVFFLFYIVAVKS